MVPKKGDITKTDLVALRVAMQDDYAFIMSTWLKGLRFGNDWYKLIDDRAYYSVYHNVLDSLLRKPGVAILVACLKEDPSVILGYSVYEPVSHTTMKLHWVQVKKAWRNVGIGKMLLPAGVSTVTHLTEAGKAIFLKKGWVFNPFTLL